jgi:hypothetical protein
VYEFTSQADDGVRVWVNDQLVIDKWHDQAFTTNKVLLSLDKGYHKIQVEHFENAGAASNKLNWEKVAGSSGNQGWQEPWVGQYFNNRDLSGSPVVTRLVNNNPSGSAGGLKLLTGVAVALMLRLETMISLQGGRLIDSSTVGLTPSMFREMTASGYM